MPGEKASDTMKLWNQVCETDPAITKQVNQRGGFTAIDAQSQLKRATELWGPYGDAWGVTTLTWEYIRDHENNIVDVALNAEFFSPVGKFPLSSDAAYKPGNDSRKKLLTDVTTKALSKLGFNSDVFEGKFDDNKYVQEQRAKHTKTKTVPKPKTPPAEPGPEKISAAQVKRLHAIAGAEPEWTKEEAKAYLATCGFESSKDIAVDVYEAICERLGAEPPEANEPEEPPEEDRKPKTVQELVETITGEHQILTELKGETYADAELWNASKFEGAKGEVGWRDLSDMKGYVGRAKVESKAKSWLSNTLKGIHEVVEDLEEKEAKK